MNVCWTSLQCHWSSTQPRVPQQSEMSDRVYESEKSLSYLQRNYFFLQSPPFLLCSYVFSLDEELSHVSTGCRQCFQAVSFNSWGALFEWGLPSVQGFYTLQGSAFWRSFSRETVGFLVWGLCRLELPPEMFTCYFSFCFSLLYVWRKDLSFMCIFQMAVFYFFSRANASVIWRCILVEIKYAQNLVLLVCLISGIITSYL